MRTLVRIWSTVFPEGIIKQETLGAVELYNSMESSKGEKAEVLKELRTITGYNQREMAESLGMPLRTWEDWEAGRRSMLIGMW